MILIRFSLFKKTALKQMLKHYKRKLLISFLKAIKIYILKNNSTIEQLAQSSFVQWYSSISLLFNPKTANSVCRFVFNEIFFFFFIYTTLFVQMQVVPIIVNVINVPLLIKNDEWMKVFLSV